MTVKSARKVPFPTTVKLKKKYLTCFFPRTLKCWCSIAIHLTLPHVTLLDSVRTTGSNTQHAKPRKAVSYVKNVFSCSRCFLNSCSWHPLAECTRTFEWEGKKEEDPETSFEPGIFPESQEANSQHANNIKESEYKTKPTIVLIISKYTILLI